MGFLTLSHFSVLPDVRSRPANDAWLRLVFSPFGVVDAIELLPSRGTGAAIIRFSTPEQASSALQLDGALILGISLRVQLEPQLSLGSNALQHIAPLRSDALPFTPNKNTLGSVAFEAGGNGVDTAPTAGPVFPAVGAFGLSQVRSNVNPADEVPAHKNLYVLNLPLDATTDQLAALFNGHGTVVHCVILAMLDAQARRRGFIDMSTAQEAKEAIESLNGYVWNGYPIEVSYAIVQRSGGPLTGPNVVRRTVPRSRWNCGPRRQPVQDYSPTRGSNSRQLSVDMTQTQSDQGNASLYRDTSPVRNHSSSICIDPYTIFITGLDPVAILDEEDLSNCLQVYGTVVACSLSRDENGLSLGYGVATFAAPAEAAAAREALDGQMQNGVRLSCKNSNALLGFSHAHPAPPAQSHDVQHQLALQHAANGYAALAAPNLPAMGPPDYATAQQASLRTPMTSCASLLPRDIGSLGHKPLPSAFAASKFATGTPVPPLLSLTGVIPSAGARLPESTQSTPAIANFGDRHDFALPMDIAGPLSAGVKSGPKGEGEVPHNKGLWGTPVIDRGPRKVEPAVPGISFGPIGSSPGKGDQLDFSESRGSSTTGEGSTSSSSVNLSAHPRSDETGASIGAFGLEGLLLGTGPGGSHGSSSSG
ncbi:unnamed protein product [Parajaminaea phylloscopi]